MLRIDIWLKSKIQKSNSKFMSRLRIFYCYLKFRCSSTQINEFEHLKGKRKCIVALAADYGNLGDVAITYAQIKFLQEKYPDYEIVNLPISKIVTHLKSLKKVCSQDDIITLVGGGFMGDLYFGSELLRQLVIESFKKNKVLSFPQTAIFSETGSGRQLLKQAYKIYSLCKNLEIWTREKRSYEFCKQNFPNNVIKLTPDIVMWLNDEFDDTTERKKITFCLRDDKEKAKNTDQIITSIKSELINLGETIEYYDTHIGNVHLDIAEGVKELNKIWGQFKKTKLVITDRLHGMIFAYITGTPAIVLCNNNFKITACYEWIKDCGYIHLYSDIHSIYNILEDVNTDRKAGFMKTSVSIRHVFDSLI